MTNLLPMFDNEDLGKLILRLSVAGMILFHGIAKILDPSSLGFIEGMLSGFGLPSFIAYGVYVGEVIGPVMVILGLYSRLGALAIVISMIFAVSLAHTGDLMMVNQFGGWAVELQALYLFGGLAVAVLGSGRLALRPD